MHLAMFGILCWLHSSGSGNKFWDPIRKRAQNVTEIANISRWWPPSHAPWPSPRQLVSLEINEKSPRWRGFLLLAVLVFAEMKSQHRLDPSTLHQADRSQLHKTALTTTHEASTNNLSFNSIQFARPHWEKWGLMNLKRFHYAISVIPLLKKIYIQTLYSIYKVYQNVAWCEKPFKSIVRFWRQNLVIKFRECN